MIDIAKLIGAILLSIALIIAAIRKKNLIAVTIIIMGIAFFLLLKG